MVVKPYKLCRQYVKLCSYLKNNSFSENANTDRGQADGALIGRAMVARNGRPIGESLVTFGVMMLVVWKLSLRHADVIWTTL